jgi:hypothetical protein
VGLVDWSPETGIQEKYYKPESFDLLARTAPRAMSGRTHPLDVTIRAAVMYKRDFRARVPSVNPGTPETEAMRYARYDVELVVLQVVASRTTEP